MKKSALFTENNRKFGVLIHPTSFPSPYGIGCLGAEARNVLRLIADTGASLWQILPLGPTGYGNSPYSSCSCFAGNEYLIDLRLIDGIDVNNPDFSDFSSSWVSRVDYEQIYNNKLPMLKKAAGIWLEKNRKSEDYVSFCKKNDFWLNDYALYRALCEKYCDTRWFVWPDEIKKRNKKAIAQVSSELEDEIEVFKALQFFFDCQWNSLHSYANSIGLKIIGDIPIFVSSDSVDAWTNPQLFKIDQNGNQYAQAGVPPDGFSADGQLWGNPVYYWPVHEKDDFAWWRKRVELNFRRCDILRIDHFRGLDAYWEVPMGESTAHNGKWVEGPGMKLIKHLKKYEIIAEDLGVLTDSVYKLLHDSKWPGMRVFEFAFERDVFGSFNSSNMYLPHNYVSNTVAYSGTHDNETFCGWYAGLGEDTKDFVRRYLRCSDTDVLREMKKALLSSCADTVIFPIQDILGLGNDCRMNSPSTVGFHNWSWRFDPSAMQGWEIDDLREMNRVYGR